MTPHTSEVEILIVGGGPVGLTLAIDLGWRGVPCHLVEADAVRPINPRCNTTGARSMEHYRRLGVADQIRAAGLPAHYPSGVSYRTSVTGEEIFRLDYPSADAVRTAAGGARWPTPEPQHRISQIFLEPILERRAREFPHVTIERGTRAAELRDDGDHVTVTLQTGDGQRTVRAQYVVGCDGAHSTVRRVLGIRYQGVEAIRQFVSTYVRSAEIGALMREDPVWTTWTYHQESLSALLAIDGREMWLNHNVFPLDTDTSAEDPEALLTRTMGRPVTHEQIGVVRWTGRQLVAERYRRGRIVLGGDAAHIWIPIAGFGMNAGIQDAIDLGWKLAAVHDGWAGDGLLDSYEAERQPIGDQIAEAVGRTAGQALQVHFDDQIRAAGEAGRAARNALAEQLAQTEPARYNPVGLNFGYHYAGSPLVWPSHAPVPELVIDRYEPAALPGCRLPHFWRADGSSVYDALGADFTLVRTSSATSDEVAAFQQASQERGIPLHDLYLDEPEAAELYDASLLLVRPDGHIAWAQRDDEAPSPAEILDRAVGVTAPSMVGQKTEEST